MIINVTNDIETIVAEPDWRIHLNELNVLNSSYVNNT